MSNGMNIFAFFYKFVGHFSNCCSLNVKTSMSRKKHPYVKSLPLDFLATICLEKEEEEEEKGFWHELELNIKA